MLGEKDIIKPLIFLDIFDYPPTALELWRLLGVKAELAEVAGAAALIGGKNGFYFLPGREELAAERSEFFHLSERKRRLACRAASILKFIPGIKMAAVCNNFYYKPESDIDFFIIVESGRMWLTRALATFALHLARLRRHGRKIKDRACLSFYIAEDNLNLESITLKPDDPYFYHWLAFLEPLYGLDVYRKFWEANAWLKESFPNIWPMAANDDRAVKDGWLSLSAKMVGRVLLAGAAGALFERLARALQLRKMSNNQGSLARANDGRVVISDSMLKFHENDRREFFREKIKSSIINYQSLNKI